MFRVSPCRTAVLSAGALALAMIVPARAQQPAAGTDPESTFTIAAQRIAQGGPPCFILAVTDFEGAIPSASGLSGLPPFVMLEDSAGAAGGRRLGIPPVWRHAGAYINWASWRMDGAHLVLSFRGPRGSVEALLRRSGNGYAGDVVTPLQGGRRPASLMLEPSSCRGMTDRAR